MISEREGLGAEALRQACHVAALESLRARYPELILNVRGLGVMLAFDVGFPPS